MQKALCAKILLIMVYGLSFFVCAKTCPDCKRPVEECRCEFKKTQIDHQEFGASGTCSSIVQVSHYSPSSTVVGVNGGWFKADAAVHLTDQGSNALGILSQARVSNGLSSNPSQQGGACRVFLPPSGSGIETSQNILGNTFRQMFPRHCPETTRSDEFAWLAVVLAEDVDIQCIDISHLSSANGYDAQLVEEDMRTFSEIDSRSIWLNNRRFLTNITRAIILVNNEGFFVIHLVTILQTLLSSDSPIPTKLLVGVHDFIVTHG